MSIFNLARLRPIPLVAAVRRVQRVRSQAAVQTKATKKKSPAMGAVAAYLAETKAAKSDPTRGSKSGAAAVAITVTRATSSGGRHVTSNKTLKIKHERQLNPMKPLNGG